MSVKHLCALTKYVRIGLAFDLDLWHSDLTINRNHLLIKDFYLPSLRRLGQSVLDLFIAQDMDDQIVKM